MLPFQGYHHGFVVDQSCLNENGFGQETNLVNVMVDRGGDSILSSASKGKKRSTEACKNKSHKEAERRRRQRINAHLSTLRTLLPDSTAKTDKASLLAEVVHRVKELRSQAAEIARQEEDRRCSTAAGGGEKVLENPFPGESDKVTLSYGDKEAKAVEVSICCEDRPGLNRDLTRVIRLVPARAVRAEMMTVGGRTKSVVVMKWAAGGVGQDDVCRLRRALEAVVQNRASSSSPMGRGKKRARVYGSVSDSDS